jgi:hypothetical protein
MRPENVLQLLESVGAIRQGHFELSSGLHSDTYVQCALVLQYPNYAEQLGAALVAEFAGLVIEAVVSPALGGVILGHEVARALGKSGAAAFLRFLWSETRPAQCACGAAFRLNRDSACSWSKTCGRPAGQPSKRSEWWRKRAAWLLPPVL